MAASPAFASTLKTANGVLSVANTGRDGTGTVVTVFSAGTNGSIVESITVQATATTTAGMVRVFVHDGTNFRLYDEIAVTAATPSATVKAFRAQNTYTNRPIKLPNGYSLRFSTEKAEAFNVVVEGGDL